MVDHHILAVDVHKLRGVAQQVLQQLRFESRARHPQPAELLRVDQAPCRS